ncbi:hypothetical protein HJC23_012532 [Cyclotella cryptica]|uniref:Glycoside hydrolase family 5 C-terminal domain-containing protein n=1 Tax=Cyclotella cryptica TaxID=29204 RepID=A0ABD3QQS5_9STRA|eukprot:CCRYP_003159-RA/>CCRYP_003159-RA protein AED:0.14 eAED:0.14 QI:18/-1/1/1/-1/1/1/145/720
MTILSTKNGHFLDAHERIVNLRGVNLSGSSKLPRNHHDPHATPTFVDRPFPPSDAPLHFARLQASGVRLLRFLVSWEAIEHAGPGIYDTEYLEYVRQILEVARRFDMLVYLDPHQDVWSRWTGGDGAPLWTLELAGFDVTNFRRCEAAVCRETYGTGHSTDERRSSDKNNNQHTAALPKMIWPTNYFKLACATMFTLFWAGERFAPHCLVDNDDGQGTRVNIQTYLQTHYIHAMAELLQHLRGLDNIVGIGTMNEPSPGYINVHDLTIGFDQSVPQATTSSSSSSSKSKELKYGLAPTPFQGMVLGEGYPQQVSEWSNGILQHLFNKHDRSVLVDPNRKRAWKQGTECLWKREGVWRIHPQTKQPELLLPNYFANVDFGTECYLPFAARYAEILQRIWNSEVTPTDATTTTTTATDSTTISTKQPLHIFVELPPLEFTSTPFPQIPSSSSSSEKNTHGIPHAINATHWYDGVTLFTRSWRPHFSFDTRTHRPVLGYNRIFRMHTDQLHDIRQLSITKMNHVPTLIGETGIPFDMTGGKSRDSQIDAMDHTIRCLEKNLLSFTLWCYTPDNTHQDGDGWNGEDLSVFCNEEKQGLDESDPLYIYDGMRAAPAVIRPYAWCMAGMPLENNFDMERGVFLYRGVANDDRMYSVPTEIFVPKYWCLTTSEMDIRVLGGRFEVEEFRHWFIVKYWNEDLSIEQRVEIQFMRKKKSWCRTWGVPFI